MAQVVVGAVLDDRIELSFHEVCRICGAGEETVIEMVREGVVEIVRADAASTADVFGAAVATQWTFSGAAVQRIQTALRLQQDLHVNLAGAALALDLLDEIARLRRRSPE